MISNTVASVHVVRLMRLACLSACMRSVPAWASSTPDGGTAATPTVLSVTVATVEAAGQLRLALEVPTGVVPAAATDFAIEGLPSGHGTAIGLTKAAASPSYTLYAIDGSGSFRASRDLALRIVDEQVASADETHRVALMAFGTEVEAFPTRTDPSGLRADLAALRKRPFAAATRLFNALVVAIERVAKEAAPGYREVVLFTDGGEESSAFSVEDARHIAELARDSGIRISLVAAPSSSPSRLELTWLDELEKLQRATGGDFARLAKDAAPVVAFFDARRVQSRNGYLLDIDLCGIPTGPSAFPITVRHRPSQSVASPYSVSRVWGTESAKACVTPCDAAQCNGLKECAADGTCADKACSVSADCGPTAHCASGVCAAGADVPQAKRDLRPWAIAAAALLLLGGLTAAFVKRRRDQESLRVIALEQARAEETHQRALAAAATARADSEKLAAEKGAAAAAGAGFALEELPETVLVVLQSPQDDGRRFRLAKRKVSVGAAPENDIRIAAPAVSGVHAEFQLFPSGDVFVHDQNSTNGTFIDGVRLAPGARGKLRVGSQVSLGQNVRLEVTRPGAQGGPEAAGPSRVAEPPADSSTTAGAPPEGAARPKKKTIYDRGT